MKEGSTVEATSRISCGFMIFVERWWVEVSESVERSGVGVFVVHVSCCTASVCSLRVRLSTFPSPGMLRSFDFTVFEGGSKLNAY